MRTRLLPILAATLLLSACENPCLTLAKKVCECEGVASEVEDCKDRVKAEKSNIDISDEQESFCESKLDSCGCDNLDTPKGQANCGLAHEWSDIAESTAK